MEDKRPKVGIGVIVVRAGKVLLGKRLNAHGEGTWCPPGGHLEFGESWEDCARRETKEETGIETSRPVFVTCTNDIFVKENKHYITIYMLADWKGGQPEVLEPDKMVEWQWFDWSDLPSPLFLPFNNLISQGFSI